MALVIRAIALLLQSFNVCYTTHAQWGLFSGHNNWTSNGVQLSTTMPGFMYESMTA